MMGKMLHMGHGVEGTSTPPAQLDAESAATVAATLQALATPSRLRMLTRLRHGACSVGDLVEAVGMEQSAVSHQLRLLRAMGLVTGTRQGRNVVYSLYDNHVAMLLDEAVYHIEHLGLGIADDPIPAL
ncbi:metalloregulator ArsR/SmtB family transcription factor [Rhodococcus baikonurensis]|jgi:ArsR family transcriptional regulator, nickel/cobalt-responsive transcriptional repressor|nr:DNA-binding transcriptional regulator, ArsR family [Rhodococcus qingshengii]|eukprot:gene25847-biopygen22300